eukprot:4281732-Pyramimonas_sp.AAC.2
MSDANTECAANPGETSDSLANNVTTFAVRLRCGFRLSAAHVTMWTRATAHMCCSCPQLNEDRLLTDHMRCPNVQHHLSTLLAKNLQTCAVRLRWDCRLSGARILPCPMWRSAMAVRAHNRATEGGPFTNRPHAMSECTASPLNQNGMYTKKTAPGCYQCNRSN